MVYVDDSRLQFGRMIMCHMVADTLEELHIMARNLHISASSFQNNPRHPHYDLSLSKRAQAIKLGAAETDKRSACKLARDCAKT